MLLPNEMRKPVTTKKRIAVIALTVIAAGLFAACCIYIAERVKVLYFENTVEDPDAIYRY